MLNNTINTCYFKNYIIQKIVKENDALQNDNKNFQKENKKLEKEKKKLEKQKTELEKNTTLEQQKKKWEEKNNKLLEKNNGLLKEKNNLEWQQETSYKKQCELNALNKTKMEKIRVKFQILKAEKISLEELVKKQQEEISELNKILSFINEVEPEKEEKTEKPIH
ncbi:hypothetical protein DVH24_003640 [Malus domestica]|uniref:Uncharacterized protein n=1 Tax=Malus domestica TaxID=3750 RepID=A0A498IMD2_MALDO|nr:hypothetical protein DVH24_003640 [Malus domestica]